MRVGLLDGREMQQRKVTWKDISLLRCSESHRTIDVWPTGQVEFLRGSASNVGQLQCSLDLTSGFYLIPRKSSRLARDFICIVPKNDAPFLPFERSHVCLALFQEKRPNPRPLRCWCVPVFVCPVERAKYEHTIHVSKACTPKVRKWASTSLWVFRIIMKRCWHISVRVGS